MGTTREVAGFAENHTYAKERAFTIHIDCKQFEVAEPVLTGQQVRDLPGPATGDDRDLWLEVPGEFDVGVGTRQRVPLRNGMYPSRRLPPSTRGARAIDAACP